MTVETRLRSAMADAVAPTQPDTDRLVTTARRRGMGIRRRRQVLGQMMVSAEQDRGAVHRRRGRVDERLERRHASVVGTGSGEQAAHLHALDGHTPQTLRGGAFVTS